MPGAQTIIGDCEDETSTSAGEGCFGATPFALERDLRWADPASCRRLLAYPAEPALAPPVRSAGVAVALAGHPSPVIHATRYVTGANEPAVSK